MLVDRALLVLNLLIRVLKQLRFPVIELDKLAKVFDEDPVLAHLHGLVVRVRDVGLHVLVYQWRDDVLLVVVEVQFKLRVLVHFSPNIHVFKLYDAEVLRVVVLAAVREAVLDRLIDIYAHLIIDNVLYVLDCRAPLHPPLKLHSEDTRLQCVDQKLVVVLHVDHCLLQFHYKVHHRVDLVFHPVLVADILIKASAQQAEDLVVIIVRRAYLLNGLFVILVLLLKRRQSFVNLEIFDSQCFVIVLEVLYLILQDLVLCVERLLLLL